MIMSPQLSEHLRSFCAQDAFYPFAQIDSAFIHYVTCCSRSCCTICLETWSNITNKKHGSGAGFPQHRNSSPTWSLLPVRRGYRSFAYGTRSVSLGPGLRLRSDVRRILTARDFIADELKFSHVAPSPDAQFGEVNNIRLLSTFCDRESGRWRKPPR